MLQQHSQNVQVCNVACNGLLSARLPRLCLTQHLAISDTFSLISRFFDLVPVLSSLQATDGESCLLEVRTVLKSNYAQSRISISGEVALIALA